MSFITFPLRFHNSFLRRSSEPESIVGLLRLMAGTPGGPWPGSANFGVRDVFERARTQPDAPKGAMERMNRALIDLGITGHRVESSLKEVSSNRALNGSVWTIALRIDATKT